MPGRIVVGVDGSEPSHEALRWAAAEAELRGARIVAAHAWTFVPPTPIGEPGMVPMPATDYVGVGFGSFVIPVLRFPAVLFWVNGRDQDSALAYLH